MKEGKESEKERNRAWKIQCVMVKPIPKSVYEGSFGIIFQALRCPTLCSGVRAVSLARISRLYRCPELQLTVPY